jgi:predicted small metal-binding protein
MKTLPCADAGFDCKAVVRAESEDEVLQQAPVYAKQVHGVDVTPEMVDQIRPPIKDEKEG